MDSPGSGHIKAHHQYKHRDLIIDLSCIRFKTYLLIINVKLIILSTLYRHVGVTVEKLSRFSASNVYNL